jgi:hypothetical protein
MKAKHLVYWPAKKQITPHKLTQLKISTYHNNSTINKFSFLSNYKLVRNIQIVAF